MDYINLSQIANSPLQSHPFPHIVVSDALTDYAKDGTFPKIAQAGCHSLKRTSQNEPFNALLDELPALEDVLSVKFGVNLHAYTSLTDIRGFSKEDNGSVHCDSEKGVVTSLLYLNETWPHTTGCLRLLSGENINDYEIEIPPLLGTIVAFKNSEKAWHGYLPYVGERKLIQTKWLPPSVAKRRKFIQGVGRIFRKIIS